MKRLSPKFLFTLSNLLVVIVAIACSSSSETISVPTPMPTFVVNLPPLPLSTPVEIASEVEPIVVTAGVTTFKWFGTNPDLGTIIEGAQGTLTRMSHGIAMTFKTARLTPGDAVTLWWLIFNRPENCSNNACDFDDLFQMDENGQVIFDETGAALANLAGREAIGFSLLRADGKVVEIDGSAEFRGHLPLHDITESYFGPGLLEPMKSEIHLIARTHGPAISGNTHFQLNSEWGGCSAPFQEPCADVQFSGPFFPEQ